MAALLDAIYAHNFPKFRRILTSKGLPLSPWDFKLLEKTLICNELSMAQLLLDYGCNLNLAEFRGNNSPLHLAIHKDCPYKLIESMVIRGAAVNQIDPRGDTPLHMAFNNSVNERAVDLMLRTHLSKNFRNETNESGLTYLHIAASRPDVGFTECLIVQGNADINCKIHVDAESLYAGYTPLHMAVEFGRFNVAELLLKNGANSEIKDVNGSTPLHLALERMDEGFIELLFAYDFNRINHVNRFGLSHFMAACACDNSYVMSDFLSDLANGKSNLDINEAVNTSANYSFKGYTPLLIAVEYGCIDTVRLLLANGARLTHTCQGLALANVATKNEFYDIVRLIEMHEQHYEVIDGDDMCEIRNNAQNNDCDCEMDWSFN